MKPRVAIVHDYLVDSGGAERVVIALHAQYPDAPIWTSVMDPQTTFRFSRDECADVVPAAFAREEKQLQVTAATLSAGI